MSSDDTDADPFGDLAGDLDEDGNFVTDPDADSNDDAAGADADADTGGAEERVETGTDGSAAAESSTDAGVDSAVEADTSAGESGGAGQSEGLTRGDGAEGTRRDDGSRDAGAVTSQPGETGESGSGSSGVSVDSRDGTPGSTGDVETAESDGVQGSGAVRSVSPSTSVVSELSGHGVPGGMNESDRYPYAIRRGSWDDERSGNRKFVMRPETVEMEELAAREVTEVLFSNTDLNVTDLREAAYIVGLQHFDEVVEVLNEWGFAEAEHMQR